MKTSINSSPYQIKANHTSSSTHELLRMLRLAGFLASWCSISIVKLNWVFWLINWWNDGMLPVEVILRTMSCFTFDLFLPFSCPRTHSYPKIRSLWNATTTIIIIITGPLSNIICCQTVIPSISQWLNCLCYFTPSISAHFPTYVV